MLLESVNQRALMAHVYAEVKGLGRMLSRMVTERGFKLQARTKLAVSVLELPETSQEWRFLVCVCLGWESHVSCWGA